MADSKLTSLSSISDPVVASDLLYLVRAATSYKGTVGQLTAFFPGPDGWTSAGETWTYVSAESFTVGSDLTGKYSKGDKVKFTQSSNIKYAYIVAVSFSSPNTTITIAAGSDYSISNSAISDNYYSKQTSPNGFPGWFNWTPTLSGWSTNPTPIAYRFSVQANICTIVIRQASATGTSNSTSATLTLPIPAVFIVTNMTWRGVMSYANAGTNSATPGSMVIDVDVSATILNLYRDFIFGTWTASGDKRVTFGTLSYQI